MLHMTHNYMLCWGLYDLGDFLSLWFCLYANCLLLGKSKPKQKAKAK